MEKINAKRVPHNPYSAASRKLAQQKKLVGQTLATLMNAPQKKKRSSSQKARPASSTTGQPTKRPKKVVATAQPVDEVEFEGAESKQLRGTFQSTTLKLYDSLLTKLKAAVGFEERGAHKFFGKWPASFQLRIDPTVDPFNFYRSYELGEHEGPLKAEDFACRPVMFWAPELQFPQFYPDGKPCCPFHPGETNCVLNNGWSNYYRRVFDENGTVALTGRQYYCKRQLQKGRAASKAKPELSAFYSYDAKVVSQAPAYIQSIWREHGFYLSSKGGISWTLIAGMRSQLAHGMSANGFVNILGERYHQSHAAVSKMWRSYCDLCYARKELPVRSLFFAFDDPRSEVCVPSLNYVLSTTIKEIESYVPFYKHKMTMNGGLVLSGDHFLKIGKVVLIDNERGFIGLYSVMNEFGKILLWRLVTGTTLLEVEGALRGLNRRYKLHGFKGPIIFTTDRCCQERSFYEGTNNRGQEPIFHSFVCQSQQEAMVQEPSGNVVKYLQLDRAPITFSTLEVAAAQANHIIVECQKKDWDVVSLDSEWARGHKNGPDVIQITTQGLDTYIFLKPFPLGLKKLLECKSIKKVASKISADRTKLAEAQIKLHGEINLQQMARDRGVVPTATVGLAEIFRKLFGGVELEKDQNVRLSQWNNKTLTKEQETYAALDSYSQMLCYLKMRSIPHVEANTAQSPAMKDLDEGMTKVLLYTRNLSAVVADGIFLGPAKSPSPLFPGQYIADRRCAMVRVENVRRPGAKIERMDNKTFDEISMQSTTEDATTSAVIDVPWPLLALWILPNDNPTESLEINFQTVEKTLAVLTPNDDTIVLEEATPPDFQGDEDNDKSCDDIMDNPPDEHSRYFRWTSGHTKQDVEHIFIRFSKVLSKQHGAFAVFMARLSDAFFVPNQADIEFVKEALRKGGLSEDEINRKRWHFFKRRIRRAVPEPRELEKQFSRVVNLMANLTDNKTGKPLFGPKAWSLYKSTLLHIRKGCLSDIPDLTYYIRIGEDSMGIPVFRCLRGTSALEGFHQKVRQLVRGFNVSPRFAIALLYEFIHRWNHDVDIRILGLPRRYANYYDGWEIEDEIEAGCTWEELEEPPHPDIECTKHFVATGEDFGVVADFFGDSSDEHLDGEIAKVLDSMKDGSWEDSSFDDEGLSGWQSSLDELTASAAWVAEKYGRKRGAKQVQTTTEKDFFRLHLTRFQQGQNDSEEGQTIEADNFTSIQWGRFAAFWNNLVKDEDLGKRPPTDMTYKSQFMLMAYYKQWKQEGNIAATMLPITQEIKEVRRQLRGPNRETSVVFTGAAKHVESHRPSKGNKRIVLEINGPAGDDNYAFPMDQDDEADVMDQGGKVDEPGGEPIAKPVAVQNFTGNTSKGAPGALCVETPIRETPQGNRKRRRCRTCGHSRNSVIYFDHHEESTMRDKYGRLVRVQPGVCSVPEAQRKKHFPVPLGKKMSNIPRDSEDEEE